MLDLRTRYFLSTRRSLRAKLVNVDFHMINDISDGVFRFGLVGNL